MGLLLPLQEIRKASKSWACLHLSASWHYVGAFGPRFLTLMKDLGRKVRKETGEEKSSSYLFQRLSMAVQRRNAAATIGTYLDNPHENRLSNFIVAM